MCRQGAVLVAHGPSNALEFLPCNCRHSLKNGDFTTEMCSGPQKLKQPEGLKAWLMRVQVFRKLSKQMLLTAKIFDRKGACTYMGEIQRMTRPLYLQTAPCLHIDIPQMALDPACLGCIDNCQLSIIIARHSFLHSLQLDGL